MIHGLSSQGEVGTRREKASHTTGSILIFILLAKNSQCRVGEKGSIK